MTGIDEKGVKRTMFRRGQVVAEADIPVLLDIGKSHIYVWEPEADEVHEDDAALALAEVICGGHCSYDKKPTEGKIQISAGTDGLFVINREALRKINGVDDYTVACLMNKTAVTKGQKLCGLRIVPLVTKRANVDRAVRLAEENYPVLSVLPYRPLCCGLIITGSEVYNGRIEDKFGPVMTKKLSALGASLLGSVKCPDDVDAIGEAIRDFKERGAELILLTGGMSVDPDDVTPAAIRLSGARLVTQGVPMQPGNMLTMAYLGDTMLIGVPGASMKMPTTSLDVFLPQIFAGLEIKAEEIAGYGEGGFCLGCETCRYPDCYFGHGV
jgi:molybdenum cofactor synthesis domain-containing protein